MLEDSPRMLQNEMKKSLGATLVAAVELFFYAILNHVEGMVSGGWDSQNYSGSGNLKSLESSLSYPVASEGPPELRAKSGSSCEMA